MSIDEMITSKQVTLYRIEYKGKVVWMRQRSRLLGWLAKQIVWNSVYIGPGAGGHFEDWDILKERVINILKTGSIGEAEVYAKKYFEEDYNPINPDDYDVY